MTQKTPASPEALARGYKNARGNLLLVVIFTVVNAFMAFMGSSSYFLFSAYLPYYSVIFGLVLTGRMDVGQEYQLDEKYLVYFVGFAVLVLGLYLLFWLFSKKHYGWLIPALVFFVLDDKYRIVHIPCVGAALALSRHYQRCQAEKARRSRNCRCTD